MRPREENNCAIPTRPPRTTVRKPATPDRGGKERQWWAHPECAAPRLSPQRTAGYETMFQSWRRGTRTPAREPRQRASERVSRFETASLPSAHLIPHRANDNDTRGWIAPSTRPVDDHGPGNDS